jgi:hypothetical protein
MDWMNWKTWTVAGVILVVVFAIYTFAAPEAPATDPVPSSDGPTRTRALRTGTNTAPGLEPVHLEWLDGQSGSYSSRRNLFSYVEPPPPPPPPPPAPPPDKDKDGIPDFQDNCVNVKNPDQSDIDRDGIGTACETEAEIAPPPPPPPAPVPPPFTYKYIGTFGSATSPLATFSGEGEIINARVGDVIGGKFILRGIGIESAEIGFVGFPADVRQRVPLWQ